MPQMVVGILFIIIILMSSCFIGFYNKMLNQRLEIENSWTHLYIQLKKRADLILPIVEIVYGCKDFNQDVLDMLMHARYQFIEANTKAEMLDADKKISSTLSQIFNISEQHPSILSDVNFMRLKHRIKTVEEKMDRCHKLYKDNVCIYNSCIRKFPNNITSTIVGIKELSYF